MESTKLFSHLKPFTIPFCLYIYNPESSYMLHVWGVAVKCVNTWSTKLIFNVILLCIERKPYLGSVTKNKNYVTLAYIFQKESSQTSLRVLLLKLFFFFFFSSWIILKQILSLSCHWKLHRCFQQSEESWICFGWGDKKNCA